MRYPRLAAFRQNTQGIAAVEFALLLPVLVLLLFGTMEIGRAVSDYQAVVKGVRDASRYVTRLTAVTCPAAGPYTLAGTAAAQAANMAMAGMVASPAATDLPLNYWTDASTVGVIVDCIDNPLNGGERTYGGIYAAQPFVPKVTVTADVPLIPLFGDLIVGANDAGVFTMSARHSQLHIGE